MNTAPQHFGYENSVASSNPGAAMLLILQILPQLDVVKRLTNGWKSMADTAKEEVKDLRIRLDTEKIRFKQAEEEYNKRISSIGLRMYKAYEEKVRVKNVLLGTAVQLQKLQNHSRMIITNFNTEKELLRKKLNDSNTYIITNKAFLKNLSMELRQIITNNVTNDQIENANDFQLEIRHSLGILAKTIQNMKNEVSEKNKKINEMTENNDELMEEKESCVSSKEELQDELEQAKEIEEDLNKLKEEKQALQDENEKLLNQILTIVEGIATYQNLTLETIRKQTSEVARGIQKYIVEPTEEASNATLKSILQNRTMEAALIAATKNGNTTEMSLLLDYGANIEAEDTSAYKLRPLHWAADQGHWNATRLLLLRGADVNARSDFMNATALHLAVDKNQLNIIDLLLKGGADIEAQNENGATPLYRAVIRDCATAKLLIDRGSNINIVNHKGYTAVFMASECVKELLCSKGATDPYCRRTENTTATASPCS